MGRVPGVPKQSPGRSGVNTGPRGQGLETEADSREQEQSRRRAEGAGGEDGGRHGRTTLTSRQKAAGRGAMQRKVAKRRARGSGNGAEGRPSRGTRRRGDTAFSDACVLLVPARSEGGLWRAVLIAAQVSAVAVCSVSSPLRPRCGVTMTLKAAWQGWT